MSDLVSFENVTLTGTQSNQSKTVPVQVNPQTGALLIDEKGDLHVDCNVSEVCLFVMSPVDCALRKSLNKQAHASVMLRFTNPNECDKFVQLYEQLKASDAGGKQNGHKSIFQERTEEASAAQYFQFYGYLSQQQNMMQDYVRTSTYQRAMLSNVSDFKDKVILDVGAGSGILSFFALQAGARKVYAVEASNMAVQCQKLVDQNNAGQVIKVIAGKIEEVSIPEQVDMLISEPMGYMLLNERMLESYLHAKKFLKPNGKMFPSLGDLHMAPFTDDALYMEQVSKSNFWCQNAFHGVDLNNLRQDALIELFKQPIVDTWHVGILLSNAHKHRFDFATTSEHDLYDLDIPVSFELQTTAQIHGLAFWFDVAFLGSTQSVWLSTAPTEPLTHWYQVRCLLHQPIQGRLHSMCTGRLRMKANARQSYDVDIELQCDGQTSVGSLDLKNPYFRYTGQPVQPPPGTQVQSPSDQMQCWWNTGALAGQPMMNGFGAVTDQSAQGSHKMDTHNNVQQMNSNEMFNPAQAQQTMYHQQYQSIAQYPAQAQSLIQSATGAAVSASQSLSSSQVSLPPNMVYNAQTGQHFHRSNSEPPVHSGRWQPCIIHPDALRPMDNKLGHPDI